MDENRFESFAFWHTWKCVLAQSSSVHFFAGAQVCLPSRPGPHSFLCVLQADLNLDDFEDGGSNWDCQGWFFPTLHPLPFSGIVDYLFWVLSCLCMVTILELGMGLCTTQCWWLRMWKG